MAQVPHLRTQHGAASTSAEAKPSYTWIVFLLAIMFFGAAIVLVLGAKYLQIDPVWELLAVPFNLAMTGALILFYFLTSSATIDRQIYKVGGAIAGFLVLFTLFYNLSREPFLSESAVIKFAQNPLSKRFLQISDRYDEIGKLKNETLTKIADSAVQNLRTTFDQLAQGTYVVNAEELPTYLLPMIKNARHSFHATQYVFPEKFWGQYWANKYFDENIKAVKERKVDLLRIFIMAPADGPQQAKVIDDLIQKHIQNGISLRLIDREQYLKSHNNNDDDLQDVLIVDDQLSGFLLLNRFGNFNRVEFSINRDIIDQRKRNFDRLLASSMSYEEWKASHPSKPQ
ncbi:hypothetical protein G6321_00002645 (plasmid) [Bradyrhizobium barranii subsp. barranii]|uniref:Uncharacterized protein n=1 Tax=Bradyrhizobium barranii subsp. barranii TaxID=2823807 RepID=A0A7Z0TUF2_9BRAD|nr:hypothetical protein [Bradyrhizobium barranii]UGX89847.1 hypothetical protein G6321_00002645 [Bradyrhizobium barranii subsp. barranii]